MQVEGQVSSGNDDVVKEGAWHVGAAALVFGVALGASWREGLGLSREMLASFLRPLAQLALLGLLLRFLLSHATLLWVLLPYLFTVIAAAYTAGQRASDVPNATIVAGASILFGTSITLALLLATKVFPFSPRFIIPISGILVSRSMAVTGITLNQLKENLKLHKNVVEAALALGATPRQASANQVKRAIVIALAPVLDTTKTLGLVSLPGAMAGMVLAGVSTMHAIFIQIVIMNSLLCTSFLSVIASTYFSWNVFFTKTYQINENILF